MLKELKLNYIECGRMSENEMNNIFAGQWSCDAYNKCNKKKGGKSSCENYRNCSDTDPWAYTYCKTKYTWLKTDEAFEQAYTEYPE